MGSSLSGSGIGCQLSGRDCPAEDKKKYGEGKICDERFYSYRVPLL
jgi:hypothetical protein